MKLVKETKGAGRTCEDRGHVILCVVRGEWRDRKGVTSTYRLLRDSGGRRGCSGGVLDGQALLRADGAVRAVVGVLAAVQAERGVVDRAQLPEVEEEEAGAREDVEDAVPDHLGGDRDDVAALRARPCDRVRDQHEGEPACAREVRGAQARSVGEGGTRCMPEKRVPAIVDQDRAGTRYNRRDLPDVEEGGNTEDVVAPLVVAVDEGADETHDDKDDAHEERRHDVGERQTGGQQQLKEQQRERDEPLDVADVLERILSGDVW